MPKMPLEPSLAGCVFVSSEVIVNDGRLNTMRSLQRPLDRFEQKLTTQTDSPGRRRDKVTLVVIAALCSVSAVIVGTYSLLVNDHLLSVLLPYAFTVIVGLALLIYRLTARFGILLYTFLVMILITPVLFQCSIGGFSGDPGTITIILWSLLAPVGALMFQDYRKAVWWFLAYLILVLTVLLLDPHFTHMTVPTNYSMMLFEQGQNIIALSITLFLSMLYFVRAFHREHARAEGLVIDLTKTNNELEQALRELKETQAELVQSEKLASLGKLAAGIAHEINSPLGVLKGTADNSMRCLTKLEQSLEERDDCAKLRDDPSFQSYMQILRDNNQLVLSAGARVAETVSNFVDFARLDGSAFDKVSINDCIESALKVLQNDIPSTIAIVKDYGDIPAIACYPAEMNQVFMNILAHRVNALAGKGTITIQTSVEKDNVHARISDDGHGMSPEEQERLFDPDFARHQSRVKAHLGLFASYNIVQKHRGQIAIKSSPDQGTTLTIVLPMNLEKVLSSS